MTKRTPDEIRNIFEAKGCTVISVTLGHSYRAGGEIFIYAPGLDPKSEGFNFAKSEEFYGFSPTGYDGRGRRYTVYLVTEGDYVRASEAEFRNADESRRIQFGAEHRSSSNLSYWVHREEKENKGLSDMENAFAQLGL